MNDKVKEIIQIIIIVLIIFFLWGYVQQNWLISKEQKERAIFNFSYWCSNNTLITNPIK